MRIWIAALGLAFISGCVSSEDLQEQGSVLDARTTKNAQNYSKCVTPKWQDMNPKVVSTETETGYRIKLDIDLVGTPAMILADNEADGARIRVFVRNSSWSEWVRVARSCL